MKWKTYIDSVGDSQYIEWDVNIVRYVYRDLKYLSCERGLDNLVII